MSDRHLKRLQRGLVALTALSLGALRIIDAHLVTAASPRGILSFEFCGFHGSCMAMLDAWGARGREFAMLSLGVDYLFLVAYASLIALTLWLLARRLNGWMANFSLVCVWLAIVAGAADAGENAGLILVVAPGEHHAAALAAAALASLKFAFVGVALAWCPCAAFIASRKGRAATHA